MNVLLAGGAGYIGSHTCISLIESGYRVILVDNFSNSNPEIMKKLELILGKNLLAYNIDITDSIALQKIFEKHKIDSVIHFAGLKSVEESIQFPLKYYKNNVLSTINLIEACERFEVNKFIFSSSATVYGQGMAPFKEEMGTGIKIGRAHV